MVGLKMKTGLSIHRETLVACKDRDGGLIFSVKFYRVGKVVSYILTEAGKAQVFAA